MANPRVAPTAGRGRQAGVQSRLRPASPRAGSCVADLGCRTRQHKTTLINVRAVRYPFHPWFGRDVFVCADFSRREQAVLHCRLDADAPRPLEIPAWMVDDTICATVTVTLQPRVSVSALRLLRQLLDTRLASAGSIDEQHPFAPSKGDADDEEAAPAEQGLPNTSSPNRPGMAEPAVAGAAAGDSTSRGHASRTRRPTSPGRGQGGRP